MYKREKTTFMINFFFAYETILKVAIIRTHFVCSIKITYIKRISSMKI